MEAVTPRFANCLGSQGSLAKKTGWWWPQCRGRERGGPATPPPRSPGRWRGGSSAGRGRRGELGLPGGGRRAAGAGAWRPGRPGPQVREPRARRPLPAGRVSMAGPAGWPGAPALQNETVNSARGQRTFPQSAPGLAPAHLSPPGNETRGRAPPPPGGLGHGRPGVASALPSRRSSVKREPRGRGDVDIELGVQRAPGPRSGPASSAAGSEACVAGRARGRGPGPSLPRRKREGRGRARAGAGAEQVRGAGRVRAPCLPVPRPRAKGPRAHFSKHHR